MAKLFGEEIIIRFLCGTIVTIIGFIDVFFPSLFNFETKSMDEFSQEIKTDEDAQKLYDFLVLHENKIVKINISYDPSWSFYDYVTGVIIGERYEEF